MFDINSIDDSLLKRHLMELAAGDYLFRQGEKGNTLYIILEGRIQLSHRIHNVERLVGALGEGEVVGERAMLAEGPYRRTFSAIATTDTRLLEFGVEDLKNLHARWPDFNLKVLSLVIRRLDRANFLVSVLQLPDPVDRVIHYLSYLLQQFGKKDVSGTRISVTNEDIALTANVDRALADQCIESLLRKGILHKAADGFLINDENALFEYLPVLKERAAA